MDIDIYDIKVDLSGSLDFVYDQQDVASCTANVLGLILYYGMKNQGYNAYVPSRLFIYYNTRKLMGAECEDVGSYIHEAIASIQQFGACPEIMWPYDTNNIFQEPPPHCYEFAQRFPFYFHEHNITVPKQYLLQRLQQELLSNHLILAELKRFDGQFITPDGYLSDITTYLSPKSHYHSVLITGFDPSQNHIIVMNSYGLEGGVSGGFFFMSFEQILAHELLDGFYVFDCHLQNASYVPPIVIDSFVKLDLFPLCKTKQNLTLLDHRQDTWRSSHYFHHIIVGRGPCGAYLAYQLQHLYPHENILIVDENYYTVTNSRMTNSSSIASIWYEDHVYESFINRLFTDVQPRVSALVTEMSKTVHPLDVFRVPYSEVWSRLIDKICTTCQVPNVQELFTLSVKLRLMEDPIVSSTLLYAYLLENGFHPQDFEEVMLIYDPLRFDIDFRNMLLYHFIYCVMFFMHPTCLQYRVAEGAATVFDSCVQDYQGIHLGDVVFEKHLPRLSMVCNTKAWTDDLNSCYLQEHTGASASIQVGYGHIYFCNNSIIPPPWGHMENVSSAPNDNMKIYLLTSSPVIHLRIHTPIGGISYYNDKSYVWYVNDVVVNNIVNEMLPPYIKNGLVYDASACSSLIQFIMKNIPDLRDIHSFMVFKYRNRLNHVCLMSPETSLLSIMEDHMNIDGTIHHLNANLSPSWFSLEGALEIVDILLQKIS